MATKFGTTGIDNLVGTTDPDTFFMTADNYVTDSIDGGAGIDTINGGSGRDLMTGGSGHDTFVFNHASDTPMGGATYYDFDRITDFVRGEDKIDLHNLVNETTGHHALSYIGTSG